jgi:hypothetical protein
MDNVTQHQEHNSNNRAERNGVKLKFEWGRLIWMVHSILLFKHCARFRISGYIIDANLKPIPSVGILRNTSGNIVSHYSNDQGQYKLNTSKKGESLYWLQTQCNLSKKKIIDIYW